MPRNFILRREHHAIGQFSATVDFHQNVSQRTFQEALNVLSDVRAELDLQAPMDIKTFNLGPSGVAAPSATPGGVGFQRFAPDGEIEASLLCDPDMIKLSLRNYTVWEEVRETIKSAFSRIGPTYLAEVPAIKSFKLEYLNEFVAQRGMLIPTTELFQKNSPWIAPIGSATSDPWHSHSGAFFPFDENRRDLVNVNCDVKNTDVNGAPTTYVSVLILAGVMYNIAGKSPLMVSGDDFEAALTENMDSAHTAEKSVLRAVLSDEYLGAIGA